MKRILQKLRITWLSLVLATLSINVAASDWVYTVVPGDNLWSFSETHLDTVLRFDQLRRMNNIQNPKRMKPGSRIRVPMKWIRSNPASAEIQAITGTARMLRADGNEVEAAVGMKVMLGDNILTGAESSVAVRFADNSILTLHADSQVSFDHLSAHGTTGMVDSRLNLVKGRLDTRVKPAVGPGSRFEIHTPSAISAVRGTEYRAAVDDQQSASNVEVLEGTVAVKGQQRQRLIKAGFGTQVAKGKPPIPPRKLLPPPQLEEIPERIRTLNWILRWAPLKKASAYRVEVSVEPTFNTIIWDKLTEFAKAGLPDLLDGIYHVRIRAIDEIGLEGKPTVVSVEIDTRPQPPVPLKPVEARVFRAETPQLQWTSSSDAASYRLEMASDAAFENTLLDVDNLAETRFNTDQFSDVGTYYWRLTSIASNGEVGPVGVVRSYEIKPVPEKITAEMQATDDGMLLASWQAGAPDLRYQVQMATDDGFNDLELDTVLDQPQLSFEQVKGQMRYLRVRGIEPDGYEGPWGATQRIDPLPDKSAWLIPILGVLGILAL